jgi:transglutaminase-like putative cysteine protease
MLLRISHETKLSYTSPVAETVFEVRMAPPTDEDQTNLGYRLRTTPQAAVTSYRDGMGNRVDLFNVTKPYLELVILATSYVRTHRRPGPSRLEGVAHLEHPEIGIDAIELLRTPVSEALALGCGVCQDFAHLFIAACRGLGLPARYVSGYVNHPGELATHAWCQFWGGEKIGWIDVDPTTQKFVGDNHVAVAFGRDYSDVPPNRGLWKGRAEETISVSVKVEPVDRVPMEWNEWSLPASRSGMGQSQRMGSMSQSQRMGRPPYPNQRSYGTGLHQQQGEQQ